MEALLYLKKLNSIFFENFAGELNGLKYKDLLTGNRMQAGS